MRARTWMAGLAAAALAAAGLVGAGTAADAAITTQPAGVSVTVDASGSNTALVSSPTVANLTVKNNSTSASLGVFTIVVPAGVSPVQAVGVQGPGNWRQTVLPCGTTANCSALVLVYASLPLSSSVLKPGQSVTSSVRFTTPAVATTLAFKFLGIGNGLFTTTSAPSINVVDGVATSFCVSSPGNLVAGTTKTFTVQAIADNSECAGTGKKIGIGATTMTVKFGTDDSKGGIALGDAPGPLTGGSTATFALPASATGLYTFTGTFKAAGNTSIGVSTATAGGNSAGFVVAPAVASSIVVNRVVPKDPTASLTAGAVFTTSYEVADEFDNVILTPFTDVKISVSGGAFTATGTGTNPVAGGVTTNGDKIAPVDGTVDGAFDGSGVQTLKASVGAVLSSGTIIVSSTGTSVTFAASNTGSALLFPGVPALVNTAPCNPALPDTTCAESNLPNGGVGAVTFDVLACDGLTVGVCQRAGGSNLVDLEGLFTIPATATTPAVELYSATHPASITLHCTVANCPVINDDGTSHDDDNRVEQVAGQDQRVDDFRAYAPLVQLKTELALTKVGSCQPGNENNEYGAEIPAFSSVPGTRHVCVDQTSFVRDAVGLSATLYFYEDFKGMFG